MILGLSFSTTELPLNVQFIDYLYTTFCGGEVIDNGWHAQHEEGLQEETWGDASEKANIVRDHDECGEWLKVLGNVFLAELQNNRRPLYDLLDGWRFLFIVGAPRTGGTYLVKEALRAIGQDYKKAPRSFYHDSVPALHSYRRETTLANAAKATWAILQMCIMGRIEAEKHGIALVPKKSHMMMMAPDFVRRFNPEIYKTVRDFGGFAQSIIDKAGGFPSDNRLPRQRSNIERLAWEMLVYHGHKPDEVRVMPYMAALRLYHKYNAEELAGIPGKVCQFEDMAQHAAEIHSKYGSDLEPEEFLCRKARRSPSPSPSARQGDGSRTAAI